MTPLRETAIKYKNLRHTLGKANKRASKSEVARLLRKVVMKKMNKTRAKLTALMLEAEVVLGR